jgi:hypothetical protein
MPLFICRWQNGDFSAVSAASKTDAIALLDEVENAEVCELFTVKNFMVHFHLKQETDEVDDFVPVELEGFGEETVDTLSERVYPAYFKAAITEGENWPDHDEGSREKVDAVLQNLNAALVKERTRQWGAKKPEISDDPEAARLQKGGLDLPKTVAERTAKEIRHRQFLEARPKTDKVQVRVNPNGFQPRLSSPPEYLPIFGGSQLRSNSANQLCFKPSSRITSVILGAAEENHLCRPRYSLPFATAPAPPTISGATPQLAMCGTLYVPPQPPTLAPGHDHQSPPNLPPPAASHSFRMLIPMDEGGNRDELGSHQEEWTACRGTTDSTGGLSQSESKECRHAPGNTYY